MKRKTNGTSLPARVSWCLKPVRAGVAGGHPLMGVPVEGSVENGSFDSRNLRSRHRHRGKHPLWKNVLAAALLGVAIAIVCGAAAIGAPLDSSTTLTDLQALIGIGLHFCVGALVVGAVLEWQRSGTHSASEQTQAYRIAGLVAVPVLIALLGGFWYWVVAKSQPSVLLTYSLGAAFFLAVGGLYAMSQNRKGHPRKFRKLIARQLDPAAVFCGAVIGLIVVVVALAISVIVDTSAKQQGPMVLPLASPGVYVALGDSYAAGEGLARNVPSPGNCHRSDKAYPWLLARAGNWPDPLFRACSGAVIHDVFNMSDNGGPVPPQVEGAPDPSVKLVTLTMGGNDSLFSKVVTTCIEHPSCMWGDFPPKTVKQYDYQGSGPLEHDWALKTIIAIGNSDEVLLTHLKSHFPNARIVTIGYPYLFPDGPAPLFPDLECASVLRRVDQPDRAEIRFLQDQFNNVLYEEAAKLGVDFVSPKAIWNGHEPCGQKGAWTNTIQAYFNRLGGGSFHPTEAGQQALAALLSCYLKNNPATPPGKPSIQMPTDWLQPPDAVGLPAPWGSTTTSFAGCGSTFP